MRQTRRQQQKIMATNIPLFLWLQYEKGACSRGGISTLQARKGKEEKKADLKSMNLNTMNNVFNSR